MGQTAFRVVNMMLANDNYGISLEPKMYFFKVGFLRILKKKKKVQKKARLETETIHVSCFRET